MLAMEATGVFGGIAAALVLLAKGWTPVREGEGEELLCSLEGVITLSSVVTEVTRGFDGTTSSFSLDGSPLIDVVGVL